MRKNFISLVVFALVYCLTSCSSSSSFESDIKKMAKYRCQVEQLSAKESLDEKDKKELEDLKTEMKEYGDKMEEKYADKKDDKEWNAKGEKIYEEEMSKCK